MLIEFSGLDCAGKSTQIDLLKSYLEDKGYATKVVWSRGGYTPGIETLKSIVRRGKSKKPEDQTAEERKAKVACEPQGGKVLLWLSIVDLVRYWGFTFKRWSKGNKVLVCDRYFWDTFIDFQLKYKDVNFEDWTVWKILKRVYRKPDVSFVLTITPEESVRRSELKFEPFPESEEKRKMRLDKYLEEIDNGRWQYVIDCMRLIEEIHADIISKVDENFSNA